CFTRVLLHLPYAVPVPSSSTPFPYTTLFRSAPIFGKRVHGALGETVDLAALLGTIFGVATSLGIGVVMVNVGLNTVFGLPLGTRSEEHTSELQSRFELVCRLLLEKNNKESTQ